MSKHLSVSARTESGVAMIITMAVLLALSIVAMVSLKGSETEMDIAANTTKRTQAFLAAEAGMARADYVLILNPDLTDRDTLLQLINVDSLLPNARFQVVMDSTLPTRKLISVGRSIPGGVAGIQVTYRHGMNPYNIWNNAVFAGHGQNSMSIRGNVGVHGSVHILGDGETFTDSNGNGVWDVGEPYSDANHDGTYDGPLTADSVALSMDGTAVLGNNYSVMSASLKAKVPPPPTVTFGGENVQTLEANLRVKNGVVLLDGDAMVGQPNAPGGAPAYKETFDGTYVTDGFTGSYGVDGVYSDNGTSQPYDLEDGKLNMPNLDDPYTDKFGTSYPTYMSYLQANALVIPGDLNLVYGTPYALVSSGKGSIAMDAAGNLTASGMVYVQGNITFDGNTPITYDGRFTLVSEGDVSVDADLLPKGIFATDDVAGVISYGRMTLGVDKAQLQVAGAFYAQEEVVTAKQTQLAGTLVSNYFAATQVPDIFQVPALTSNLPPGLPGTDDVLAYVWYRVPKSWVELD